MIYKDKMAGDDKELMPAKRYEPCLNCGRYWNAHNRWACDTGRTRARFSDLREKERYLTQAMLDSKSQQPQKEDFKKIAEQQQSKQPETFADWRMWAADYNNPEHCKCGRLKKGCEYHDPRR